MKIGNFHDSSVSKFAVKRLEHKENQTKYRKMTRKPQSHVRILKCKIERGLSFRSEKEAKRIQITSI